MEKLSGFNKMTLADLVVRNEEATGSIPVSSTIFPITCTPFLKIPFNKGPFY